MHVPTPDPARPVAIEDASNRWLIHPLAEALLPPALRFGIHPNAVSLAGLGFGAIAGVCYANWQQPAYVVAGFLAMLAWHVMDGLDGKLARASGKASPFGRLLDGACDYLVFFFVLIPIALSFPDWFATLVLCLTAGVFHGFQAVWYEGEREAWMRRARGVFLAVPRRASGLGLENGYNRLEARFIAGNPRVDTMLMADPGGLSAYLAALAPLLRRLNLLSANNRTIAIALACLAGEPRLYWLWEMAALTLFALLMARLLRRTESVLIDAGRPMTMMMPGAARQAGE